MSPRTGCSSRCRVSCQLAFSVWYLFRGYLAGIDSVAYGASESFLVLLSPLRPFVHLQIVESIYCTFMYEITFSTPRHHRTCGYIRASESAGLPRRGVQRYWRRAPASESPFKIIPPRRLPGGVPQWRAHLVVFGTNLRFSRMYLRRNHWRNIESSR